MQYRLYSKKEVKQGEAKSPAARHKTEKVLETENFEQIMDEAIGNYKITKLSEADIRIIDGGCEWHLSNVEIAAEVEKFAEDYANKLEESLEDSRPVVLKCPECDTEITVPPYIHENGDLVCGDCSDPNKNGPKLEVVE